MKRFLCGWIAALLIFSPSAPYAVETIQSVGSCKVLFSPDDRVADALISLIASEKKSIKAAVYCLMHKGIADALIEAHKRGVPVEVIVDPYSVKARSPLKRMHLAKLPVFVWNPPETIRQTKGGKEVKERKPLMHDKFCVLGDSCVWTGSFNFTFEATRRNRENVVVLENRQVAARYLAEFERLKAQGCTPYFQYVSLAKAKP